MDAVSLLQDFATILLVAAVTGWIFRKLGLSAVVGYLLAGVIIGPYTPPFTLVSNIHRIEQLSDLGLVFLMFFVGLGLSLKRIKSLGLPIVIATGATALGVFNLAQIFGWAMGWSQTASLVFAAMFMASSSAIITKMLAELGLTHERFAQGAQGITVLEDVVAVVMLTIIGSRLQISDEASRDVGQTLFLLLGFTVLVVVVGLVVIPKLLRRVSHSSDSDVNSIFVSGLVFAAGAASINSGFSAALGAFLIGVVIAETPFKSQIEKRLSGAQDMFSAIFFVSIGMLIDVKAFAAHWPLILAVAAFAIVARALSSTLGLLVCGAPTSLAAATAVVVTPVGEFSYIIAQIGVAAGAVEEYFYAVAVGASIITAALGPLFAKNANRIGAGVARLEPTPWHALLVRYRGWLDAAGARLSQNAVWQLSKRRVSMALLELFLLAGLFGFSNPIHSGLAGVIDRTGFPFTGWHYVFWALVIILGIVLIVAIWRSLQTLSMIYAEALTMRAEQAAALRPLVQFFLQFLSAAGLALLVFFTFPIQTRVPWIALVLIVAAAAFAAVMWRHLVRLHGRFETSLASTVQRSQESGGALTRAAGESRHREWGLEIAECVLPDQPACAGKSIQDTALRSQFGCSILEIDRGGFVLSNPNPSTSLFPGDRILLVGTEAQLRKAQEFLVSEREFESAETDFDQAVLETIEMPADSPATGRTLAGLQIFARTGVQIVGIQKGDRRIINPRGDETLDAGSALLVTATSSEIRKLQRWLENPW